MESQWELVTIPHGIKRAAEDSLEGEQPLAKRLSLLSLRELNGKVNADATSQPQRREKPSQKFFDEAPMQIDDTKDRIYIYNLEDESSDGEAQDEKSVLTGPTPPAPSNELVLYNVPSSLSVPEEQDSVRKAIIETRARAREQQAERIRSLGQQENVLLANGLGQTQMGWALSEDADAMEIG